MLYLKKHLKKQGFDMENILVTGGAGYIGSHTCKALSLAGYYPITYDNMVCGHSWAVKWGPLEEGDINDRKRLDEVIDKYKPSAVLHFAALAYVGESVIHPRKYFRNNVAGSMTLLEAMCDNGINNIVFSSSCATYGNPEVIPIPEEHSQNPINPYGASKFMVERILQDFDHAYNIKHVSLRYFNAAGAGKDGDIGECHEPETHLIPLVLETALGKRPHISIFGDNHKTTDGTCVRDYIHVEDLAQAHIAALKFLETHDSSERFNLGNRSRAIIGLNSIFTRSSIFFLRNNLRSSS
jgi:UDP-arabinose 4-epimerase